MFGVVLGFDGVVGLSIYIRIWIRIRIMNVVAMAVMD